MEFIADLTFVGMAVGLVWAVLVGFTSVQEMISEENR